MTRIHNFSAGPAVLPLPVLERAREALLELNGSGLGLLECSHRSALFDAVVNSATSRLRALLRLDDDQDILFLHGGASTQFFMVPMNLLRGGHAAYHDTGVWSAKAIAEARRFGTVDVPFSSKVSRYDRVPAGPLPAPEGAVYLHYTSNNTVAGSQYHHLPDAGDALLVADMSSDILCRPIDGSKFDVLYAGAQKNMGPSGVTLCVFRKSLVERCDPELPTMLRYETHVKNGSMFNTPNTFGIYVIDQVCRWIEDQGGLDAVAAHNQAQADAVYAAIDGSGFYRGKVDPESRSWMNLTFTTGDDALDTRFHKEAAAAGLSGLKGHRSMGGLRASLYNAQTDAAVSALVDYMRTFEQHHG